MNSHDLIPDEKPIKQAFTPSPEIDVLVIGAGPVGLRFVIEAINQAKRSKNQNFAIALIERNKTYTRVQDLTLNADLLESDPYLKQTLHALIKEERASLDSHGNIHISIQELEQCLASYANKLGIQITYKRFMTSKQYEKLLLENQVTDRVALEEKLKTDLIVDREELIKLYPNCKIIFGADGARSSVRQLMSGTDEDASVHKTDLRHLVEVKYLVHGKAEKLSKFNYYRSQALLHGFLCSESIKYVKDKDQSQVTIRFLVDEKTYHDPRLNHVNAKNLLPLCPDLPLPSLLKKVINTWVDLRGDAVRPGSATINKTVLSIYSSKTYGTADDMHVFLPLGDAASGFPYMNGLNLGTEQAIQEAKIFIQYIDAILKGVPDSMQAFLNDSSAMTKAIFDKGFKIVAAKDHEIANNHKLAQSVFVSSVCVKMTEQSMRERDHDLFRETPKPYCLDLHGLNAYVEKYSLNHESYLLSMRLLELLVKHQRMVIQDPHHVIDVDFLKAVLSLACYKNQAIAARAKSWGMLSSLSKYAAEPIDSRKARCDITLTEIEQAMAHPVTAIPEHLASDADTWSSRDALHDRIYQLFQAVLALEATYKCSVTNEDVSQNRHRLLAREETPTSPITTTKYASSCAIS